MLGSWLRNLAERRLTRSYIQFMCLLVLAIYLIVFLLSFSTSKGSRTIFGPHLGADFGAFYVAGKIFNEHSSDQIYQTELQDRLYREQFPDADADSRLPYVNAPFFVLPFTLLSRLPYSWAYLVSVVISLALYLGGLALMRGSLDEFHPEAWWIALLLAVSFMPFLVECLAGGQTSAVGFFCLAAAMCSERRGRLFLSGLALSVLTYKITLLLLILPMLLISRRYKTLLGFLIGGAALAIVSWLAVGWQGCVGFINTLLYFTSASTSAASGLRTWKYVDINSFFRLLLGAHAYLRWLLTGAAFLISAPFLFKVWRQRDQGLVWAVTITATVVLNLYVGIYDSTLVVLSALLISAFLFRTENTLPWSFKLILMLLYVVPWVTQPLARVTGVQLFTIVLAVFFAYALALSRVASAGAKQ